MLAHRLVRAGYKVKLSDPKALDDIEDIAGTSRHENVYEAIADSNAVVLMTDWPEYRELDWNKIKTAAAPDALVVDSWRTLKGKDIDMDVISLGRGTRTRAPKEALV